MAMANAAAVSVAPRTANFAPPGQVAAAAAAANNNKLEAVSVGVMVGMVKVALSNGHKKYAPLVTLTLTHTLTLTLTLCPAGDPQ
jgi:hypothetical protein